jgi:hypothetical protein
VSDADPATHPHHRHHFHLFYRHVSAES